MKLNRHLLIVLNIFVWLAVITVVNSQTKSTQECAPYYAESITFMSILKAIGDYGSKKWASTPPTPEELPNVIEFWCIKPQETQFKQMFMDKKFTFDMPVAFIVHGYFGSMEDSSWLVPMAKSWIQNEKRAVCIVDWRELAIGSYCTAAKRNTKIVGSYMAKMIKSQGIKPIETVLVGHSLGAHISGICGHELNGQIRIIYGLDPAGPHFTFPKVINETDRLDIFDAIHVQCIHTNRGVAGTFFACGDSDYYANYGYRQTGCITNTCSHVRAAYLFEASLNSKNIFIATECGNDVHAISHSCKEIYDRFGIHGKHLIGQFYFETSDCYPYLLTK